MQLIQNQIRLSASDLVNFLGCRHLTELDREVALGLRAMERSGVGHFAKEGTAT